MKKITIISIDAEKTFDKTTSLHDKIPEETNKRKSYFTAIYDKPIANIIPTGTKLKVFPAKSGMRYVKE
jgi:hypothetical protein